MSAMNNRVVVHGCGSAGPWYVPESAGATTPR